MINEKRPLLLIEDDEGDVFIMRRALRHGGITNPLHIVTDGRMAIEYLSGIGDFNDRDRFPEPAIVFLDLKLPLQGGFEVLSWIRRSTLLTRLFVVVLTSSDQLRDMQQAYRLGAHSYIVKPPAPETLRELVHSLGTDSDERLAK